MGRGPKNSRLDFGGNPNHNLDPEFLYPDHDGDPGIFCVLRSRGHNYSLPHIEFSLYKNSFVNRCLFNMI